MVLSNTRDLMELVMTARSPKELILENVAFGSRSLYESLNTDHAGVETLVFDNCFLHHSHLEEILHHVAAVPSLKTLQFDFDPDAPGITELHDANLTNALVHLFNHNNTLKTLKLPFVSSCQLDFGRVVASLSNNTSLHTLIAQKAKNLPALVEILQQNTTLKDCRLKSQGRHDQVREKAIELLRLNQFGRGKVRAAGTTKEEFIKILCVVDAQGPSADTSILLPIDRFNLQHGLLREAPSLWSS